MIQIVLEVDVLAVLDGYTHETSATRGVNERFLLIGSTYKRGVATELFDGFAVGRTELHFG